GTLRFGGSSANFVSIPSGATLTVGPGITVDGQKGIFGTPSGGYNNSDGRMFNEGPIAADEAGQPAGASAGTIWIQTDGGLTNASTLEASNGGTLGIYINV